MKRELALVIILTLLALAGVVWTASSAEANPNCGATIRGKVVLDADWFCPGNPPSVVGPRGHLDLNGHILVCSDGANDLSVKLLGQNAKINNGTLERCWLQLFGRGGHRVERITIRARNYALWVRSPNNTVIFNSVNSERRGPLAMNGGPGNLVADNIFRGPDSIGIDSSRGYFIKNRFTGDLYLHGRGNRVLRNTFEQGCPRTGENPNLIEGERASGVRSAEAFPFPLPRGRGWNGRTSADGGRSLRQTHGRKPFYIVRGFYRLCPAGPHSSPQEAE